MSECATRAFLDTGNVEKIMFIGSAGSIKGVDDLEDVLNVGDIGIPMQIYSKDGRFLNPNVENQFLGFFEDEIKNGLYARYETNIDASEARLLPTEHTIIETPFFETRELVDQWRRGYFDSVDCELGHVVEQIERYGGKKPEFAALTFFEDVIDLAGHTLGEIDRKIRLHMTRTRIVDMLLGGPLGRAGEGYLDVGTIKPAD